MGFEPSNISALSAGPHGRPHEVEPVDGPSAPTPGSTARRRHGERCATCFRCQCGARSLLLLDERVQAPLARYAFEGMLAAVREAHGGSDHEILDGWRHEDLAGAGRRLDARRDV